MKKILIIAGLIWLYFWWKKKHASSTAAAAAAPAPAAMVGSGSALAMPISAEAAAAPFTEVHKSGLEVLRLHGNITDRGNNQRLAADISTADAQGLSIGDTVNLMNSNIYRGYYKIMDIVDGGSSQAIVLDTHYVGGETGTYISTEKTFVSGFHAQLNKRSAFK